MKITTTLALAAGIVALSACNQSATEQAADNREANAEMTAENIEANADLVAENIEANAENAPDATSCGTCGAPLGGDAAGAFSGALPPGTRLQGGVYSLDHDMK